MSIKLGTTAQSETMVDIGNTAISIGSGSLPVFSTPSLVALMENAATKCINDCFDETQTTVGIALNIEHTRASAAGEKIIAKATLVTINGRELLFNVEAYDSKGIVGHGLHKRFVINIENFMRKLK
ncbi:MAG: dihydrolipoamide acyltransferase [Prevotellaceae bacterium]|jgi:predicted thioesterase|nr:dihydrolipoamide acyltransferase [Prevotellaceae bacterium]